MWKRLALALHTPLQRVQAETTSSEFTRWMIFLEQEELEKTTKQDFYMAALTAEVRRSWVSGEDREKIQNETFLIKPRRADKILKSKKVKEKTPAEKEEYLKKSKSAWFALTGFKKGDPNA